MPNFQILACPTCGGSLSVAEYETESTCQFCGNTIVVPLALRTGSTTRPTIPRKHITIFAFLGARGLFYCLCAGLSVIYYLYVGLSFYC